MKKRIIAFMLVILTIGIVFAQDMTPEQFSEYNRLKLSVEEQSQFMGSVSLRSGVISGSQVKYWTGYQGFLPISEQQFYTIAGYKNEAAEAKKYKDTSSTMLWGGMGALAVGTGMMLVARSTGSDALMIGAGIFTIGGSLPLFAGVNRHNWSTAGNAFSVAEDYNARLKKQIISK